MEVSQLFDLGSESNPEEQQQQGIDAPHNLLMEPESEVQEEGAPQEIQGEPEAEDEQEVPQIFQDNIKPEAENEQEVPQFVRSDRESEEEKKELLHNSHGSPELYVEQQEDSIITMVDPEVQQEHEEPVTKSQLIESNMQQKLVNKICEISKESEVPIIIGPMASDLRPSRERARGEILPQIMHLNMVSIASEFQSPWIEDRNEILLSISFNTEQVQFRIPNITVAIASILQEFTINQNIPRASLTTLFRMLFEISYRLLLEQVPIPHLSLEAPPRLLALEAPPRLLALEAPPRLLALEGPPQLLALDDIPQFLALECPNLLLYLDVRILLPPMDSRHILPSLDGRHILQDLEVPAFPSQQNEIFSNLQENGDLIVPGPFECESLRPSVRSEVQDVRSRKTKAYNANKQQSQENTFDPGQQDAALIPTEFQRQLENENQNGPGPRQPGFLDARELLKDLDFGVMKAGYLESKNNRDLEMKLVDLEMEGDGELVAEGGEALEMEAGGYQENLPLFPPECQRLDDEVIEITEEPGEVALNVALPDDGGNRSFDENGSRVGEADMEAQENQFDEAYRIQRLIFYCCLFGWLLLFLVTFHIIYNVPKEDKSKGNGTLLTDMDLNATSTIFNETSLDYNATTTMDDLKFNDTYIDI